MLSGTPLPGEIENVVPSPRPVRKPICIRDPRQWLRLRWGTGVLLEPLAPVRPKQHGGFPEAWPVPTSICNSGH